MPRTSSEGFDIIAKPRKSHPLVSQSKILRIQRWRVWELEDVKSITIT